MNCTAYCCVQLNYKYERHPTCMPYLNKRLHIMTNMSIEKSYIGDTRSNTKTTDEQNRQPGPQDVKSCESAFPFSAFPKKAIVETSVGSHLLGSSPKKNKAPVSNISEENNMHQFKAVQMYSHYV